MPNSGNIATISGNLVTNSGIDLSTKADLVNGLVPSIQLPSYVDDVLEFANFAGLPATGETGKIYVTLDNNKIYRWSGSTYIEISASPGSTDSVAEGSTNLYFTNARARAAISLTTTGSSGAATYDNVSGVLNIPNYTLALASYLPLTGGTLTGALNGTTASFSGAVATSSYLSISGTTAVSTSDYLYKVGTSLYWKRNRLRSYIERTITSVSTAPADYNKYYEIGSFAFSSLEGVFEIDLNFNGSGYGQGSRHIVPVSYAMDYLTQYSTGLTAINGAGVWLVLDAVSQTPRHLLPNAANWELQMNVNNNTVQFRIVIKGGTAGTATAYVKISHNNDFDNCTYTELTGTGTDATAYSRLPSIASGINGTTLIQNNLDVIGDLAVGLITPLAKFHVSKDSGAATVRLLQLDNSNTTYSQNVYLEMNTSKDVLWGQGSAGGGTFWNAGTRGYGWSINGTRIVTYDSSGNIGIGITAPVRKLQINEASANTVAIALTNTSSTVNGLQLILDGTGSAALWNYSNTSLSFGTNNNERMRIDASGNLGLGVTPSAWNTSYKAIDIGNVLGILGGSGAADLYGNLFFNASSQFIYKTTAAATAYSLANGQHRWYVVASGTAGAAATLTANMTLTNAGRLLLGSTSDTTETLQITGTAKITGATSVRSNFEVYNYAAGLTAGDLTVDVTNRFVYVGRLSTNSGDNTTFVVRDRTNVARATIPGAGSTDIVFKNNASNFIVQNYGATQNFFVVASDGAATFSNTVTFNGSAIFNAGAVIRADNGTAAAPSYAFESDLNTGIYRVSNDVIGFTTGGTEKMRLDNLGNLTVDTNTLFVDAANNRVGIGTLLPNGKLSIIGSLGEFRVLDSGAELYFTRDGNNDILANGGTSADLTIGANNNLIFKAGSGLTERMRITASGNLGLGTTSPLYKLDVQGTSGTVAIRALSNVAGDILYYATGTVTGSLNAFTSAINATGSVGASLLNANTATGSAFLDINVTSTSTGDPYITFTTSGVTNWSVGIDNSDSDKLKIGPTSNPSVGTPSLTIDTTGNVGIGTTTPGFKLDVVSSSGYNIIVGRGASGSYFETYTTAGVRHASFGSEAGGDVYFGARSNNPLIFLTNNTEQMRVTAAGNVGIGTTSPNVKLDVNGSLDLRNAFQGYARLQPSAGNTSQARLSIRLKPVDTAEVTLGSFTQDGSFGLGGNITDIISMAGAYFSVASTGRARLNNYGAGTFSGTVAYNLAVDSSGNIIETAGGVVDGSGTANYIPKWNDANTLGNSVIVEGTRSLGINTATPVDFGNGTYNLNIYDAGIPVIQLTNSTTGQSSSVGMRIQANANDLLFINSQATGVMRWNTNGSERMRLDASGNLGIGTANPLHPLDVTSVGNTILYIRAGSATSLSRLVFGTSANTDRGFIDYDNTSASRNMSFKIAEVERMRLDASGNLGIGTSSPTYRLDVLGSTLTEPLASPVDDYTARFKRTYVNNNASVSGRRYNIWSEVRYDGNQAYTNTASIYAYVLYNNTNASSIAYGNAVLIEVNAGSVASSLFGTQSAINLAGTIANATLFRGYLLNYTTGTTTNAKIYQAQSEGAVGTITNLYGFMAESSLTNGTNNYGFYGNIYAATGANRWNLYMAGTADNYLAGSLGIGIAALGGYNLRINKAITGGAYPFSFAVSGGVQSDVTAIATYVHAISSTQAATFTLPQIILFNAEQGTFGAGSVVTAQTGFNVTNLSGATTNVGFSGNLSSGTGKWNLYMGGTANNYFAGSLGIGVTVPIRTLHVNGGTGVRVGGFGVRNSVQSANSGFIQVGSSDNLYGMLDFNAYDSNTIFEVSNTNANNNAELRLGGGFVSFRTGSTPAERMRINASGDVGIGSVNIYDHLFVSKAGGSSIGIGMAGAAGTVASPIYTYLNFRGYGDAIKAQLSSYDVSSNVVGGMLAFSVQNTSAVLTEYMRITSTGNVGIGTSSPAAVLHSLGSGIVNIVQSTNTVSYTQYYNTSTGSGGTNDGLTVGVNGTTAYVWQREADALLLGTSNTEAVRITSTGNVGINNTNPGVKLDVTGAIRSSVSLTAPEMYGTAYSTLTSGAGTGTAVYDTLTTSGPGAYEVVIVANPNGQGSGSYRDWYIGKVVIGTGYNGAAVVHYIDFIQQSPMPRTLFGSGGGDLTVTAVFNNSGTESEEATVNASYTIRFKISGYTAAATGSATTIYLKKIGS